MQTYLVCKRLKAYIPFYENKDKNELLHLDTFLKYVFKTPEATISMAMGPEPKDMTKFRSLRVFSVDSYKTAEGLWEWNDWHTIAKYTSIDYSTRSILKWLREQGILLKGSVRIYTVEDDGYNFVIKNRKTGQPYYAIEHCGNYL